MRWLLLSIYSPNKRMTSPWFKNRFKCPDTLRDAITNNPRKTKNLRKFLILSDLLLFVAGFFVLFDVFNRFFVFYYLIPKSSVWNLIRTLCCGSTLPQSHTHTKKKQNFILRSTTETVHKFHTAHLCILFFYLHFI